MYFRRPNRATVVDPGPRPGHHLPSHFISFLLIPVQSRYTIGQLQNANWGIEISNFEFWKLINYMKKIKLLSRVAYSKFKIIIDVQLLQQG